MAKRKAEKEQKNGKKDLLARVRECLKTASEADEEMRRKFVDDMKFTFVPGEQWDANQKKKRGKRPCYEFNKLRVTIKRVINNIRANRPMGKVRATEDGDKDTADVIDGLIRNIWAVSDADTAIDYAAEQQTGGGMGAWRVNTRYSSDTTFDQDIVIESVRNPLCLYPDPACRDPLKRDADYWIYTDRISRKSYEMRWPNREVIDFDEGQFDDEELWEDEDETVRICEYWYREPVVEKLLLLADGKTVKASEYDGPAEAIKRTRDVQCYKIKMCIASGDAILEERDWAGSKFPWIIVYGDWVVIEGKTYWNGMTRFSKDAQRSYNVSRTAIAEQIASAPNSHWWATADQAKGHTDEWGQAHDQLFPFLLYNADAKSNGAPPQRMGGADVPVALIQESQIASEEIKAVTGIFDPSLGNQSNETSGRAIAARAQQGEIATFNYPDNIAKGIRVTYEILIDLIPKVYDTERSLRILGVDGAEKYVKVNQPQFDAATGKVKVQNDLTRGKYDVTVTVGPSFSTQRQEAVALYSEIGNKLPQLWAVAGDLMFRSMDLPYAEQIAERFRTLLPPEIQKTIADGKPVPPEVQAVMQQAEQAMAQVQQMGMLVQQAAQEAQQEKAESEKAKAEVQTLIEKLKTEEARFEAKIAKEIARITQMEAGLTQQGAQLTVQASQAEAQAKESTVEQDRENLVAEAGQAVQQIQQLAQQFAQFAAQIMQQIEQKTTAQQAPRRRQIRAKRVNGELIAQIDELDDLGQVTDSREARVRRENGELVGEA
jgi:hypothetical protein